MIGAYPIWVFLVIVTMFVQFLVTSKLTKLVFDSVGKYYGSLLYGAIGLTLLFSTQMVRNVIAVALVGVSGVAVVSRGTCYLKNRN